MNKESAGEIHERAHNKAFSKMIYLNNDIKRAREEIRDGGDGLVTVDLLKQNFERLKLDLKTWEYIAKLIETEDFIEPVRSNVEMLHGMMGLADPSLYDMDVDYDQIPSV